MFLEVIAISFIVALLRGGRLQEDPGLKRMWTAPVAYLLQVVNNLFIPPQFNIPLTAISYGLLLYFALINLNSKAIRLILVGILLNAIVIAVNAGRIPVDIETASKIGVDVSDLIGKVAAKHAALADASRLKFLGDVIPMPYPIPRIISVGDIFALIGTFLLVQDLMGKHIVLSHTEGVSN